MSETIAITERDLQMVCGTVIPAGSLVEVVETFEVNRERHTRMRIRWGGRLWQCESCDLTNR